MRTTQPVPTRHDPRRRFVSVRGVSLLALVILLLGAAGLPALSAAGANGTPAVSPTVSPDDGFPLWYEDSGGTRLAPCLDPTDANCVIAADAGFDPTRARVFPTNYPSEFFYLVTDSAKLATPGCQGTKRGTASMRAGLEGAFANGTPAPGQQMVFARVRITVTSGLCANSTYTATTPFGQVSFTTGATGGLARNQGTTDTGCVPVAPATCDFSLALASPVARSFVRWDPTIAPTAPAGYLGDATTPHRIIGASYTAPGEAAPANYFRVSGPRLNTPLRSDLFTVAGRIAGPLTAAPGRVDLAGVQVGQTSAAAAVTVTNLSANPVAPGAATFAGPDAAAFQIVTDGCTGVTIARDATCQIIVAFTPTSVGSNTATLQVPYAGLRSPLAVPLAGEGIAATQAPVASASPTTIAFGDNRLRVPSASQQVTVTNTGTAPLSVGAVALEGPESTMFSTTFDTCTGSVVAVGATCRVDVSFNPQAVGSAAADLVVPSNDAASPLRVALSGTGFGGVAAVSTTLGTDGFPDWYQDERGIRLGQCIDPADPNCIVLAGGNYPGTGPVTFPDTFPDEFFYTVTDSDLMTTPGCGTSLPGKAKFRAAVEGAFVNGTPVPGEQMTFGRVRFSVTSGLCPGQEYTFVHPYGTFTFTADAAGGIKVAQATDDVGCLAATITAPCDVSAALASRVFAGFLRWDPAVSPAAPAGYLGDAATLHKIVGAPYTHPGDAAPANSVRLFHGPDLVTQTDLFTAMGRLVGPLVSDPAPGDFGNVEEGATAARTVTLRNDGIATLTISALAMAGGAASDFTVTGGTDTCTGTELAAAASCTVGVTFAPTTVGDRSAALRVTHTGLNSPFDVALHGVGQAAAGLAALSTDVGTVGFEQVLVGRSAVTRTVTVSNRGGTGPLVLEVPTLTGSDPGDFTVAGTTCDVDVPIDGTCTVTVGFTPTAAGPRSAGLHLSAPSTRPASLDVALTGRGFTGSTAVAATLGTSGFPQWYQDANGVRLSLCDDVTDPGCIVLAGPGFDPGQPLSFPSNYPPEVFYAVADSDVIATPGCEGSAPGTAMLRLAAEAAFTGTGAEPGQQITFGRIRFNATSGLCPSTTYTFVTPYGAFDATTDAAGAVSRTLGTQDVGCGAAPCDFAAALTSPVFSGFVRWAPGVGASAPTGHLGDAISLHPIVGGTYAPNGTPVNHFEIIAPDGSSVARTSLFTVSGKLATGISGDSTLAFGDHDLGTTTSRTLTYTNVGADPVTPGTPRLTGPDAAAFAVTGGTCTGGTLARDDTCTVGVDFVPTVAGDASASLQVPGTDGTTLATTALTGHGVAVAAPPRATLGATSLSFATQRVGTTSAAQSVTVTNTGGAPLTVNGVPLSGPAATSFTATPAAGCASVVPGASCQVAVTFAPTATGTRTATLTVQSNDPGAAPTVTLTGTGTSSIITLKNTTLDLGTAKVGQVATKTMTLTNTGTAPLTITSLTSTDSTHFAVAVGTCVGPIAPGRTCNVSVTLLAQAAVGTFSTTVGFISDAANSPTLAVSARVG